MTSNVLATEEILEGMRASPLYPEFMKGKQENLSVWITALLVVFIFGDLVNYPKFL